MKILVDAHLPMRLVYWLRDRGHDAIHTLELPQKNETEDIDIIQLAVDQNRAVITKDDDFLKYFILHRQPPKLLMLTMGNVVNRELINIFGKNIDRIEAELENNKVVELSNEKVTVHF